MPAGARGGAAGETMAGPGFDYERELLTTGAGPVCGVDEAGRGPLAGPVSAAAVILDPTFLPEGVDDSKKLAAPARELLYDHILDRAVAVGIGFASVAEIERINIRAASLLAMARAIRALPLAAGHALIDGNALPDELPCRARAIVSGDALCLSIAAASIVAKVTRDRLMNRLHLVHPKYGFATNAGYSTAAHLAALDRHGPTAHHRRGFAPVRLALDARSAPRK